MSLSFVYSTILFNLICNDSKLRNLRDYGILCLRSKGGLEGLSFEFVDFLWTKDPPHVLGLLE